MAQERITVKLKEKTTFSLTGNKRQTKPKGHTMTSNSGRSRRVMEHLVQAGKASIVEEDSGDEKQGKVKKGKETKAKKGSKETKSKKSS